MPYVYSTSTAGIDFAGYRPPMKGQHNVMDRKVSIAGGSNVANKHLLTPLGVPTKVTDDELAFLQTHPTFIKMSQKGFFKVVKTEQKSEKVVADMTTKDESAPLVPQDFADGKAPKIQTVEGNLSV